MANTSPRSVIMPGLLPGTHVVIFLALKTWMAGSSP
jgi:hypothetical protein